MCNLNTSRDPWTYKHSLVSWRTTGCSSDRWCSSSPPAQRQACTQSTACLHDESLSPPVYHKLGYQGHHNCLGRFLCGWREEKHESCLICITKPQILMLYSNNNNKWCVTLNHNKINSTLSQLLAQLLNINLLNRLQKSASGVLSCAVIWTRKKIIP